MIKFMVIYESIHNLMCSTDIENPVNIKICIEILKDIAKESGDVNEFTEQLDDKELQKRLKAKWKQDTGNWLGSEHIEYLIKETYKAINRDIIKSTKRNMSFSYEKFYDLYN